MTVALEAAPPRPRWTTYGGLFMVTLATLMYEIALTRIFSVTMWYHFAFAAISFALFGLTVGALLVHLLPNRFPEAGVGRQLWLFSILFAVSIAVCISAQLFIRVDPQLTLGGILSVLATSLIVSIPFVFGGVVVCLALTRFPDRVNRLYAADLVGAALGCVLLVIAFNFFDGPSLVIAIAAIASIGSLVFAAGFDGRRALVISIVVAVLLGSAAIVNTAMHSNGDPLLRIRWTKDVADSVHNYDTWNAFSRISIDEKGSAVPPYGWGFSKELPSGTLVSEAGLTIDNTAYSVLTGYTGKQSETDFLRYDVSNLAHYMKRDADVLVIGVGGGRDILSALEFDQHSVTGVEINDTILDAVNGDYGEFTGHLDRNPKVEFVNDEARSYLARTDREYDIIQISLIDTWAATSAGAYALSENSLYTKEAWDLLLDRLKPGGVLSVSRWYYYEKPLEAYRTAVLAAQALKDRGVENPRDHMLIYVAPSTTGFNAAATFLVSPEPFTKKQLDDVGIPTLGMDFEAQLTPDFAFDKTFARITVPEGPGAVVDSFDEDISAPSDERPFFFLMADTDTFFSGNGFGDDYAIRPVLVLLLVGLVVLLLALVCIALPLIMGRRRSRPAGMVPFYTYFAGIGFGFLLIEISQLQRLNVYLGHPTYALAVVLFSVLLFSGVGSMLCERLIAHGRPRQMLLPLIGLLVIAAIFGIVTPEVISATSDATTPMRILISIALIAPLATAMGMPFAIGMREARERENAPTAFFWGINGATSVCASVLGIVLSVFFGISVAFWAGTLAYVIALAALTVLVRRRTPSDPGVAPIAGGELDVEAADLHEVNA